MKTMTIKILATCIFATTLLFSGCKKGDTGPAGPTGATGTSGSANVTTTTGSVIAWSSLNPGWEVAIPTPALTAAVQGKAAVEVFLSIDTAKHWIALPYTTLTGGIAIMSFTTSTNLVTVTWTSSPGNIINDPNTAFGTNCMLKIVVIPPAMIKPNVNSHDYNALRVAYDLKE